MVPTEPDPKRLSEIRRSAGLTQAQLAHRCGLSVSYITKLESGARPITEELWQRLSAQMRTPDLSPKEDSTALLILLEDGKVVAVFDHGVRRVAQLVEFRTSDQDRAAVLLQMLRSAQSLPVEALRFLSRRAVELLAD